MPVDVAASAIAAAQATPQDNLVVMNKIVVAIHGVGSQRRGETIRYVTSQFGQRVEPHLATMPLGFFHICRLGEVKVSRLDDVPKDDPLEHVGFAEVFWADIPRGVVKKEDTLEETKAWGKTVVSRAEAAYRRVPIDNKRRMLKAEGVPLP